MKHNLRMAIGSLIVTLKHTNEVRVLIVLQFLSSMTREFNDYFHWRE